jgi:hypothetical protein
LAEGAAPRNVKHGCTSTSRLGHSVHSRGRSGHGNAPDAYTGVDRPETSALWSLRCMRQSRGTVNINETVYSRDDHGGRYDKKTKQEGYLNLAFGACNYMGPLSAGVWTLVEKHSGPTRLHSVVHRIHRPRCDRGVSVCCASDVSSPSVRLRLLQTPRILVLEASTAQPCDHPEDGSE